MTTTLTVTPATVPVEPRKSDNATPASVTLEQLALEMKLTPRDARMLLRLAAKQTKQYPNLGKDHVPRQPWLWTAGSKALEDARKALANSETK